MCRLTGRGGMERRRKRKGEEVEEVVVVVEEEEEEGEGEAERKSETVYIEGKRVQSLVVVESGKKRLGLRASDGGMEMS